jgi:transposase
LLKAGKVMHAEIGRRLGVSRAAVGQWAAQMAQGGVRALKRRTPSGRPPKLTVAQQRELIKHLKHGACRAGFPSERWTLPRVQALIQRVFGVRYHPKYVGRLLARLDWSRQQPQPRAIERDEALIRAWLAHDWPRIKKGAAQRRAHRVFR